MHGFSSSVYGLQVTAADASTSGRQSDHNYPIESAGLSEHQLTQLHTYMDYLLEVNKVMNLTGAPWLPCAQMETSLIPLHVNERWL